MDARSLTVLAVAGIYLGLCVTIGLWPTRKSSDSAAGFVAGDRTLGLLLMYFITGATIFSAFAFLGLPGWAATKGAAAYYILAYGILGFLPFYFLGPRAARVGREYGFVTQAEMVSARFGSPSLAGLFALISLIAFVPYLALQIQGAGLVLEIVSEGAIDKRVGGLVVYAIVALYVSISGVLGVGWTNVFQGVFMLVLAWGLGLYLPHALYGGVGEMFERIATEKPRLLLAPGLTSTGEPWSWGQYSSTILVFTIGFSFWPHLFMKAFSARDGRTLRRTVVLYPSFMLFLVPLLLIGFAGALFEPAAASADRTLPHLLMSMDLPAVVVGLFCAGGLAASMSSGDAITHASASIIVRDALVTAFGVKFTPHAERRLMRFLIFAVVSVAYGVTLWKGDSIVGLLVFAYGPVTMLGPAIVATLCWRRATGAGLVAGLLVGIGVTLALAIEPAWKPWDLHQGLYGLVANVAALVGVSLMTRRGESAGEVEFLAVAGRR